MKPLTLARIAEVCGGRLFCSEPCSENAITGVVRDNREVEPGNLFVCFVGERADGHDFVNAAFASGASACLCEHEPISPSGPYILVDSSFLALKKLGAYYRSLFTIPIIGITGSVGKTTAKEMCAAVLGSKFSVLKTEKNLNNEIGVPLMLLKLREEHQVAVIEMGISDFGEMSRLADMVRPDICLITNIGYCHLEYLGDLNGVLRAKTEVFQYMKPSSLALLSGDDQLLRDFETGTRRLSFGYSEGCDFRAVNAETFGADRTVCDILYADGRIKADIHAYGLPLILGALAASAVGHELGLSDREIERGLSSFETLAGRSNVIETGFLRIIDDCYNANPNSVTAALISLSSLSGKRVAILGDMNELGTDSKELHSEIGAFAGSSGIECLISCGEKACSIYEGLIASGSEIEAWHFPNKHELFAVLPSLLKRGDSVLVKASHGMRFEEIVDELKSYH